MAFKRVDKDILPPRRWALKGRYGDGKSTFILAMQQPALIVDADGRRHELKGGELYELSEEPADNRSVERIQDILDRNMPGSGIKTIAIDSITSLIGSSIARAMLDNAADRNRNKNQAWVDKAEKMRLLQDFGHGARDACPVGLAPRGRAAQRPDPYPRNASGNRARAPVPVAQRLAPHRAGKGPAGHPGGVVARGAIRHGDLGRAGPLEGRAGADRSGTLRPGRRRQADTSQGGRGGARKCRCGGRCGGEAIGAPQPDNVLTFYSPTEAIAWAVEQGAFADSFAAEIAYEQLRGEMKPRNAKEMYIAWIGLVRKAEAAAPGAGHRAKELRTSRPFPKSALNFREGEGRSGSLLDGGQNEGNRIS